MAEITVLFIPGKGDGCSGKIKSSVILAENNLNLIRVLGLLGADFVGKCRDLYLGRTKGAGQTCEHLRFKGRDKAPVDEELISV